MLRCGRLIATTLLRRACWSLASISCCLSTLLASTIAKLYLVALVLGHCSNSLYFHAFDDPRIDGMSRLCLYNT
jgi:hypothetical protein